MTQPLFFDPYPDIENADMLGIGDLVYPDGRREYSADPELAGMLDRYPGNMQLDMPQIGQDVGAQQKPPVLSGMFTPEQLAGPPPTIQGQDGSQWRVTPQGLEPVNSLQLEQPTLPPLGGEQDDMGISAVGANQPTVSQTRVGADNQLNPGAPPPVLSGRYTPEQLAGPPPVIDTPRGPMQVTPQGFQPYQREGALPPELAAEQLGQLGAQQQATLQATEQARMEEARLVREYTAQRMGEIEAEKAAREQEIAEQQAKIDRWNGERQRLADMEIETDLVSARGPIGAALAVAGAALLGAVGSDAGLRMIDKAIDTNVREQVRRRDTKLGLLSEEIQSSRQAIAFGKAKLYETLASRVELMAQKTKNDIFEAQTPAIVEQLKQRSLAEYQKAEQESLGKLIERMPQPAATPFAARKGYGEASAAQTEAERNTMRALNAIGAKYDPQTGRITNRAQIEKEGLSGINDQQNFLRDLGKVPVIGALPQAYGNYVLDQKGRDIQSALAGLVETEAMRLNNGRAPTDADREAARQSLGFTTVKGTVDALERMMGNLERTRAQNIATYGAGAAQAVEGTMGALGQTRQELTAPSQYQQLEPGRAREQLQQERSRQQGPRNTAADALERQGISTEAEEMTPEQRRAALGEAVQSLSQEKGIGPEGIAILLGQAGHETNDFKNMPTNNAFGMKSTPRNMARGAGVTNLMTTEGSGSNAKRVKQNFATFDSAADAAADMISLLERKYPRALEALQAGDVDAYVAALKDGGYFTGNEGAYLSGIKRRL